MRLPFTIERREQIRHREVGEGTETTGIQPWVSAFWEGLAGTGWTPRTLERVWTANRCIQLNAQQIASMPLRFFGASEPAWVANPDPHWYPNGIGDAVFAATWSMYGYGDAFLYITDRYATGYPSAFTVLQPEAMHVDVENGRKVYTYGQRDLDPRDVVQVTRDPKGGVRGTSALQSYSEYLWAGIAGAQLASASMTDPAPNAVLKSARKLTKEQAEALQAQWAERAGMRRAAPAVLGPDIDFEQLAFSPRDLMLLDTQQFTARVVASAFGVPPFLLNLPMEGGLTYQNPEMLGEVWWRTELRPAAMRISRALTANMLPRGSWVEFDARDVVAPTMPELVSSWLAMLEKGTVTIEEFRAAVLRLPPQSPGESVEDLMQPAVAAAPTVPQNGNGNGRPVALNKDGLEAGLWTSVAPWPGEAIP